ncbi:Protein of unknown function [Bacillus mycoides]|nr:hypothetical protein BG05_3423 [Bacillus mycoides]KUH43696.1 hypothetical protein M2E15_5929 [Bacillus mycoides]SFQ69617.1 Protein of unknown function [Bacillus mycoides]
MKLLLIVVAVGLLWFISFLHIYWAFGGRWGSAAVIPVKEGEHNPDCCSSRLFAGVRSK